MGEGLWWWIKRRFRELSALVMTLLRQRNEVSTFSSYMYLLASFSNRTWKGYIVLHSTFNIKSLMWVFQHVVLRQGRSIILILTCKIIFGLLQDMTICDNFLDQSLRQLQRSIQPFVLAMQWRRWRSWWILRHNCQLSTKLLPTSIRLSFSVCSYKVDGWDITFAILTF